MRILLSPLFSTDLADEHVTDPVGDRADYAGALSGAQSAWPARAAVVRLAHRVGRCDLAGHFGIEESG